MPRPKKDLDPIYDGLADLSSEQIAKRQRISSERFIERMIEVHGRERLRVVTAPGTDYPRLVERPCELRQVDGFSYPRPE